MFFTFPEDARWNEKRQAAVEFGVALGEYEGVVRLGRNVFWRFVDGAVTSEACIGLPSGARALRAHGGAQAPHPSAQRRRQHLRSPDTTSATRSPLEPGASNGRQLPLDDCRGRAPHPARIKIAVPPDGLDRQLTGIMARLDANCGAGNWAMTPAGFRGVVNDAIAIYFFDPALASAFVTRWCLGFRVEPVDGSLRLREHAPPPRTPAKPHG